MPTYIFIQLVVLDGGVVGRVGVSVAGGLLRLVVEICALQWRRERRGHGLSWKGRAHNAGQSSAPTAIMNFFLRRRTTTAKVTATTAQKATTATIMYGIVSLDESESLEAREKEERKLIECVVNSKVVLFQTMPKRTRAAR